MSNEKDNQKKWHKPEIQYLDPASPEELVAEYNARNPHQFTTVKFMTMAEIEAEGLIDMMPDSRSLMEVVNDLEPTYKIIQDEEKLKQFIDFLPDLEPEQKFYYSLFARKKYGATEGLKSDKCQLKRGTTTKERMLRDFKKLETIWGTYTLDDIIINQESLVLYITPNPRDMHKAALNTAKTIVSDMAQGKRLKSPQAMALNEIQVAGVKKFFNIDIDLTEEGKEMDREDLIDVIKTYASLNEDAMHFVHTRGGFHLLVELAKVEEQYKKTWYQYFNGWKTPQFEVDMSG